LETLILPLRAVQTAFRQWRQFSRNAAILLKIRTAQPVQHTFEKIKSRADAALSIRGAYGTIARFDDADLPKYENFSFVTEAIISTSGGNFQSKF
jgi:hypothetical protein